MYTLEEENIDYFVRVGKFREIELYFDMMKYPIGANTDEDIMIITTVEPPWSVEMNNVIYLADRELYLYYFPAFHDDKLHRVTDSLEDFLYREFELVRYKKGSGFYVIVRDIKNLDRF